jgi:membrane protein YdbS with pleckstrin-like domain
VTVGGIAPEERDLSRRRDREAAWVLAVAAAVGMVIFFPLGLVLGLVAAAYAWVSGASEAFWVAIAIVLIGLVSAVFGLTDFDGGVFQG